MRNPKPEAVEGEQKYHHEKLVQYRDGSLIVNLRMQFFEEIEKLQREKGVRIIG